MSALRARARLYPGLGVAIGLGAACSWNLTAMGAGATRLADGLGVGLGAVGVLGALLWLTHALCQLPGGRLIDRFGPRPVAIGVLCGVLVLNAAACLVADAAFVGVTRVLCGMFVGAGSLCAVMYVRGPTAVARGFVGAATSAGAALPLALVPALGPVLEWRGPFLLGAVFTGIVLAGVLLTSPAAEPSPAVVEARLPDERTTMRELATDPSLIRLSILLSAQTILCWTMGNWIVTLLEDDGRFSVALAGVLGALIFAGGIISRPVGAWISSHTRVSGKKLIASCLLSGSTCVAVIAAGAPAGIIVAAVVVLGLTASMPWAVILHAAAQVRPNAAAAGVGAVGTAGTLAAVASIPLFGVAFDSGHEDLALWVLAGAAATSVLALVGAKPRQAVTVVSSPVTAASAFEPEGSGSRP